MKRIIYIAIFSFLLSSCEKPINEFQSHNFVKYFGNGIESVGYDVIQLADGSYVLTGYDMNSDDDNQILVVKIDKYGNQIWNSTYGSGSVLETGKVVKEGIGGYYIAGTAVIAGPVGGKDTIRSFILKTGFEGDSIWYKEFSSDSADIEFNDMLVDDEHIYVAGQITFSNTNSDVYALELSLEGELTNTSAPIQTIRKSYEKVFKLNGDLVFIGEDKSKNIIILVPWDLATWGNTNSVLLNSVDESFGDALLTGDALYILSNNQSGTALLKMDLNFSEVWKSETIPLIEGKSFAIKEDGKTIVFGQSGSGDDRIVTAVSVNSDGELGAQSSFKTLAGTISNAKETLDGGIVFIGSTPNATFGITVQLIKTDADLFLLKP